MRKKNKLYTANKWNQPLFARQPKNLFGLGDAMQQAGLESMKNNLVQGENLEGLKIEPGNTGGGGISGGLNLRNVALGGTNAAATALSPTINKWITNGYETNGVGQTITTVGNALGDAAEAIPVIGKFLGPGVKLMSGVFGGLYNRTFGIKENTENIAAVKNNTAVAQNAAAGFNSAATTNDVLDLSRNMTSSLGLSGDDLYKGGWAKSAKRKAGRKANKLTNLENAGLAMQGVGLATGADNVMNNQYDDVMSKSFADGGYLPFDMISTPNMGAIDYGLKYDYLNMKNNQINAKNSNNIFAIGGDEDVWAGVSNKDLPPSVLLSRLEARRRAAKKPTPVPGVFGGGEFGGSGTTGRITEGRMPYEEEQRDTLWVPYTQTFEDAFRNARQQGLDEFTFNGKRYNTEMGDNPDNNAAARSRTVTDLLPLVLDRKSKKYKRVGLKAFGGDLATNSSDFATGLTHIEAGGSHESNPYEGVQVGVDSEGVPNLVEEGETIFNDYVYSNRINIDDTTKKKFHIGKKREMTYAELSKKLEEEVSERPNDPISQASLKVQMQQLADEQERQKQEMEAERARVAFESLSDEEKIALMQQAVQQEQAQAEMAAQPTEEEMMAQEQMAQQMNPEEMAMMQQQAMQGAPTADAMAQPQMAYGGNLFYLGGGLKWLQEKHPELSKAAMNVLGKAMDNVMSNSGNTYRTYSIGSGYYEEDYDKLYRTIMSNTSTLEGARKTVEDLKKIGMDNVDAYNIVMDTTTAKTSKATEKIKSALSEDLRKSGYYSVGPASNQTVSASTKTTQPKAATNSTAAPTKASVNLQANMQAAQTKAAEPQKVTRQKKTFYKALDGKLYNTREEAFEVNKPILRQRDAQARQAAAQAQQQAPVQAAYVAQNVAPEETAPSVATTESNAARTNVRQNTRQAVANTNTASAVNSLNTGSWNDIVDNPWNTFVSPGFDQYLAKQEAALLDPTLSPEQKAALRQQVANEINEIQQSYFDNVAPTYGQSSAPWSQGVANHQQLFQNRGGNVGFTTVDENGNVVSSVEDAIDKPNGADTADRVGGTYVDGYNGPKTNIRYWGATGDNLDTFVQRLANMGIDFAPNKDWTFGNDNRQLYKASIVGASPQGSTGTGNAGEEEYNYLYRPDDTTPTIGLVKTPWSEYADNATTDEADEENKNNNGKGRAPKHRWEGWRYAGLFGPAVGLGMQLAGVGRPDFKDLDAAIDAYNKRGSALADYQPIGNYIAYRPMDIWAEQNRLNANARATDRAIQNNAGPLGTQMAGLLANNYNNQIGSGNLYRQALEYNDNLRKQVADFNRATDMFNAQAYNQTSQTNAGIRNQDRAMRAQLAMDAARTKMDANAGWYNGIYGNIGGLFEGISELGRENAQRNWLSDLAADGAFGNLGNSYTSDNWLKRGRKKKNEAAKGGKLKKRNKNLI